MVEETTIKPNETTSTTTERYRISRKDIGYILGRNYRGLQKLLKIELNDAANVSLKFFSLLHCILCELAL